MARFVGPPSSEADARIIENLEPNQGDLGRPVLPQKIFRFSRRANHLYDLAPFLPRKRGVATVTTLGRNAVDERVLLDGQ
jgi:hypothetical protein